MCPPDLCPPLRIRWNSSRARSERKCPQQSPPSPPSSSCLQVLSAHVFISLVQPPSHPLHCDHSRPDRPFLLDWATSSPISLFLLRLIALTCTQQSMCHVSRAVLNTLQILTHLLTVFQTGSEFLEKQLSNRLTSPGSKALIALDSRNKIQTPIRSEACLAPPGSPPSLHCTYYSK